MPSGLSSVLSLPFLGKDKILFCELNFFQDCKVKRNFEDLKIQEFSAKNFKNFLNG